MAVDSIRPLGGREATFGRITEWTANRRWLVHTTSRFDEEWQILEAGWNSSPQLFPVPYTNVLASQPLLLCRSIGGRQQERSPQHWIVTAEYSSAPLSQQQQDAQQYENPLDRPSAIRWNSVKYSRACIFDTGGNLILMSSGEPPDPPAEMDASNWVVSVRHNEPAIPAFIIDYTDAVNTSAFTIQGLTVDPYVAKIMEIEIGELQTAQISETEAVGYYPFAYSMELRGKMIPATDIYSSPGTQVREGWKLRLLDQGYWQKDPNDSTKRIRIQDDSKPPRDVVKPWPLNGLGARLSDPTPSTAKSRVWDIYNYKDFGVLPGVNSNP